MDSNGYRSNLGDVFYGLPKACIFQLDGSDMVLGLMSTGGPRPNVSAQSLGGSTVTSCKWRSALFHRRALGTGAKPTLSRATRVAPAPRGGTGLLPETTHILTSKRNSHSACILPTMNELGLFVVWLLQTRRVLYMYL